MWKMKNGEEYTLWGVIIRILCIGIVTIFCMGNFWYTDHDVLDDLRTNDPTITRVIWTERNIFSSSVVYVEMGEHIVEDYCLDTNLMRNFDWVPCEEE